MAVEERVAEEQFCRLAEQLTCVGAGFRQPAIGLHRTPYVGRRFVSHHGAVRQRLQPVRNPIHEAVTRIAEFGAGHLDGRHAVSE